MSDAAAVDQALQDLVDGEKIWAATPLGERRRLLEQVRDLVAVHAQDWVDAAAGVCDRM